MYLPINKKYRPIDFVAIVALLISLISIGLFSTDSVFAAPCGHSQTTQESSAGGCDETNWQDAQKNGFTGNKQAFNALRDRCQGTDSVNNNGSYGGVGQYLGDGYSTDTESGNCSNAIKSCYQSSPDPKACEDPNVLAIIASCNEGAVGAGGSMYGGASMTSPLAAGQGYAGCGVDNAIFSTNYMKGTDYKNNRDVLNEYIDNIANKECNQTNDTDIKKCKEALGNLQRICEIEQGLVQKTSGDDWDFENYDGQRYKRDSKTDTAKINSCVARNAHTEHECVSRGGEWNADADIKCSSKQDPNDEDGDGIPDKDPDAKGPTDEVGFASDHCGQARVNLLVCTDDENQQGAIVFNNLLKIILQVLTALVGIAAVGGLAFASVTYARAEDNSNTTGEAKALIRNIVIGILLYGFLIAIVSWLLPGVSIV